MERSHELARRPVETNASTSDTVLICFSHLRWGFVWQRPQHLLTRAARDYRVLYVEEPVFEAGATPHLRRYAEPSGVTLLVPVLPDRLGSLDIDGAQASLIRDLLAEQPFKRLIAWYYTPMAMPFTASLPADLRVYDNMDELSAFRGASPEMLANEAQLFSCADLVFTGGRSLFEAKRGRHSDVHLFPSSIEYDHFAAARSLDPDGPADQAGIARPRLGFAGVIDERMDLGLVRCVAQARPDWQIIMVGPVVKIDPVNLPRDPNVHWLGGRPYPELPGYMAGWDCALMPFALNESTRFISPTKTPEYLAAGLPVVSTRIADVVEPYGRLGLVQIADEPEEFVAAVERCLRQPAAERRRNADAFLSLGSWDGTWASMRRLIDDGLARPSGRGARQISGEATCLAVSPAE